MQQLRQPMAGSIRRTPINSGNTSGLCQKSGLQELVREAKCYEKG